MSNGTHHHLRARFNQFARKTAQAAGHPYAFLIAAAIIVVWALTGPIFQFNDTWQLVINTGTTIVTFLMVFLIQNTQNRDSLAMQIKMDEVIRAVQGAHNSLLNLEELEDEELEQLHKKYEALAERARVESDQGATDGDCPELEAAEQRTVSLEEAEQPAPTKRDSHKPANGAARQERQARIKARRKARGSRKSA